MAICGTDCDITGIANVAAHAFALVIGSSEQDVRAMNGTPGGYGEWLACAKTGTLTINHYQDIADGIGDEVTVSMSIPPATIGATGIVQSKNYNVDAKGLVEFTTVIRLTGDLT